MGSCVCLSVEPNSYFNGNVIVSNTSFHTTFHMGHCFSWDTANHTRYQYSYCCSVQFENLSMNVWYLTENISTDQPDWLTCPLLSYFVQAWLGVVSALTKSLSIYQVSFVMCISRCALSHSLEYSFVTHNVFLGGILLRAKSIHILLIRVIKIFLASPFP